MRFKVGQQVMVRHDFTKEDCKGVGYVPEMEEFRGEIVTIKSAWEGTNHNGYKLKEDRHSWSWNGNQFIEVFKTEEELLTLLVQEKITSKEYNEMLKHVGGVV